jgi:hypothetical protein
MKAIMLLAVTFAIGCGSAPRAPGPARPCLSQPPPPPPTVIVGGDGSCPSSMEACLPTAEDAIAMVRVDRYAESAWLLCGQ